MIKKTLGWLVYVSICLPSLLCAELVTRQLHYQAAGLSLQGYLAYSKSQQALLKPAVLVVHEWWGHNAYARKRAEMLAELGYVAFALDMYGDNRLAHHPDDARKFAQEALSDQAMLKKRFLAALDYVKRLDNVDKQSVAAIGYCFGGAVVLNMARAGVDLAGVVSFHGALATDTPAGKNKVSAKVLVLHGGNDAFIPEQQVAAFESEMKNARVDYQLVIYQGAEHSFTNPQADSIAARFGMPLRYHQQADLDSWQKMQTFFDSIFFQASSD